MNWDTDTARPRARNRRGEGRLLREELLDTASRMLDELGDADLLSLRGLAAEVGIAAPSIYRHFPDKAALLVAVVERSFGEFDEAVRAGRDAGGDDPFERLRLACHAYLHFGRVRPAHYGILFSGGGPPDPPPFLREAGGIAFGTLVDMVAACLVAGPGGADLDAFTVAMELWAMLHGLVDLPFGNPAFPWPAPEVVNDTALARLRATVQPRAPRRARAGPSGTNAQSGRA